MRLSSRVSKNALVFGSIGLWALLLVACVAVNRTMIAPPFVAGATFVGNKACSDCHEDKTAHFGSATHAKVSFADAKLGTMGCETCHGAGSLHQAAGGGRGNIINPRKSPETCFQCHPDKRGEFSLANSHGVLAGKMSCADCHDPHSGNMIKGKGASLESANDTCTKCHSAQKGPFTFKHNALKEGCTACHNPHGTVNQRMLVARDANLCLGCHLETSTRPGIILAGGQDHRTRIQGGACWSAGCHEAVHGSHASPALRY